MIKNIQRASIEVMEIVINRNPNINNSDVYLNSLGKEPLLWYNGILIPSSYISSFCLDTNGFFPVLKVFFSDQTELMKNKGFALDNTIISIFIDSRTKQGGGSAVLSPIRMDFKIVDFGYLEDEDLFYIQGFPNIDGLYLQKIKSYRNKTSLDVLTEISKETKLGFSTNIQSTDDIMNWLNIGMDNRSFIEDVTDKAYKSDVTFFTSFIDYYYNLNFIDVETQLKEDINNQKGVITMSHISVAEEETQRLDNLFLITKNVSNISSNNTINNYTIANKSTKISLKNGYRSELYYYDRTGNWEEKAGTFLKFVIETNTDGKGIVLKSYPSDNKSDGFFKSNSKKIYMKPLDVDNTHPHYNYASLLNKYNNEEIEKLSMVATLSVPNFNLHKFQKIKVIILDNKPTNNPDGVINERLSGGWLITAINFTYTPEEGMLQHVKMIKRELSDKNISY